MVARQNGIAHGKAQMAGKMPRRVDCLDPPPLARKRFAVAEEPVGVERLIHTFPATRKPGARQLHHDGAAPGLWRAEPEDRSAGFGGQPGCKGAVIAVGMRDDDMTDPAARRIQDRGQVGIVVRAWINDGAIGVARNIGVRPPMGHRRRVGRENATKPRRHLFGKTEPGSSIHYSLFRSVRGPR